MSRFVDLADHPKYLEWLGLLCGIALSVGKAEEGAQAITGPSIAIANWAHTALTTVIASAVQAAADNVKAAAESDAARLAYFANPPPEPAAAPAPAPAPAKGKGGKQVRLSGCVYCSQVLTMMNVGVSRLK